MKRSQFKNCLLLIFLMHTISLFAQKNWFPSGAKWYFNIQDMIPFDANGYEEYRVSNDTIIEGHNTKIIERSGYVYNGNELSKSRYFVNENENKVYYWHDEDFTLMYDFNLKQNDTLDVTVKKGIMCDSASVITVDSVTEMTIDSESLHVQYISYTTYWNNELGWENEKTNIAIIENIGHEDSFIFAPVCDATETFVYYGLRCYTNDNFSYHSQWWQSNYPTADCDSLINTMGVASKTSDINEIKLFPNPVTNELNCIMSQPEPIMIEIYNVQGFCVLKQIHKISEYQIDMDSG